MATGRKIKVYIGKETTFGEKASVLLHTGVEDSTPTLNLEKIESEVRTGKRTKQNKYIVSRMGTFSTESEVEPVQCREFILGVLGSETVEEEGNGYKHTFTPADTLPSYTMQQLYGDEYAKNSLGAVINTLEFNIATKAIVKMSIAGMYQDEETEDTPETTSRALLNGFKTRKVTLKIDDEEFADAKNLSMTINNNLYDDDFRLNNDDKVVTIEPQTLEITGNLQAVLNENSLDLQEKYLEDTEIKLEIEMESTQQFASAEPYKLKIILPRVNLDNVQLNTEIDQMTLNCEFEALEPSDAEIIKIELINDDDTGYVETTP